MLLLAAGGHDSIGTKAGDYVIAYKLKKFGSSTGDFSNFNRHAFVGLSNRSMDTLQVGRNLLNSHDVWNLDLTGQQFIGSATLVQGRNRPQQGQPQ